MKKTTTMKAAAKKAGRISAKKLARKPANGATPLGAPRKRNSASTAKPATTASTLLGLSDANKAKVLAADKKAADKKAPRDPQDVAVVAVDVGKARRARIDAARKAHDLTIHDILVGGCDLFLASLDKPAAAPAA